MILKIPYQYGKKRKIVLLLNVRLNLLTLNLVTTCDLVIFFQRPFFNLLHIKSFDIMTLCDLVTIFEETKSITKSRLHGTLYEVNYFILKLIICGLESKKKCIFDYVFLVRLTPNI